MKKVGICLLFFSVSLFFLFFFLQPKSKTVGIYVPGKNAVISFEEIQKESFLQSIINDPFIKEKWPKPSFFERKDKIFSAKKLLQALIIKKKEDHWILQLSINDPDLEKTVLSAIMHKYQKMEEQAYLQKERQRKEETDQQIAAALKEIGSLQKKQALLGIKDPFSKRKIQKRIEKIDRGLSNIPVAFQDPFLPYISYLENQVQIFARFGLEPCEKSQKQLFKKTYQKQKIIEGNLKELLLVYRQIKEEEPLNTEVLNRHGLKERWEKRNVLQERLFTDRYLLEQEKEHLQASVIDIEQSLMEELRQRLQKAITEYKQGQSDILVIGSQQHGYFQKRLSQIQKQRSQYLFNCMLRTKLKKQNLKDKRDSYRKILFSMRKKEVENEKSSIAIDWQLQQEKEKYRLLKEKEMGNVVRGIDTFCLSIEKSGFWIYIYSGLLICLFVFFASIIFLIV